MKKLILILFTIFLAWGATAQQTGYRLTVKTGVETKIYNETNQAKTDSILTAAAGFPLKANQVLKYSNFYQSFTQRNEIYIERMNVRTNKKGKLKFSKIKNSKL